MPSSSDNQTKSTQNSRIIRVRDLPIYYDSKTDDINRYSSRIDDDQKKPISHNWLYSSISQTRQSLQQIWNDNKELRSRILRGLETGEAHTKATIDYIRDDQTLFPKVGVVTIAGLGGLLLGHKSGPIRKTFYSSVAVAVALSACYPKQSANLLDQVYIRIKNKSNNLFNNKPQTSLPTVLENKDRILHTAKIQNEPIVNVKGDYGQGTPADQHLYTTRGNTQSTSYWQILVLEIVYIRMTTSKTCWPELVGKTADEAVELIKQESGLAKVHVCGPGSRTTRDIDDQRVRVYVDENNIVTSKPTIG